MGRAWGLDIRYLNKTELVDLLEPHSADPERIERAVRALSPRERAALDLVILSGGRLSTHALRGQLESQGLVDARPSRTSFGLSYSEREGLPSKVDSPKFEDILARFGVLGLAFPWPPSNTGMLTIKRPATFVAIPVPILRLLPSVTLTISTAAERDRIQAGDPDTVLRDLMSVLSAIRREPIELTKRGLIPKRSLVRLAGLLAVLETELAYPALLARLATDLGLLVQAGGRLQEGSRTASFLERPRGERLRALFDAYGASVQWSELVRIPGVTVRGATQGEHVARGRRRVLDMLSHLPPGH